MIGEILAELGLWAIIEFVVYGTTYWIGYGALSLVSMGRIPMATFSTLGDRNNCRRIDWSPWLNRDGQKYLKMESVCLAGLVTIILAGVAIYSIIK